MDEKEILAEVMYHDQFCKDNPEYAKAMDDITEKIMKRLNLDDIPKDFEPTKEEAKEIARIMAKVKYMNIGNKIWYFFLDKDGFIDVRKIGDISEMMRK